MRKMRLAKREIQEKKRLMEILEQAKVLRIGTMDQEGIYIVPVNYGYSWEEGEPLRFYIHSAKEGRKVQAFAAREDVGFELDLEQGVIRLCLSEYYRDREDPASGRYGREKTWSYQDHGAYGPGGRTFLFPGHASGGERILPGDKRF